MTDSTLRAPEKLPAPPAPIARGTGRFARFTYGTGAPHVTPVVGASMQAVDWNNQTNEK